VSNLVFDPENRKAWLVRADDPSVGNIPDGEYMAKSDYDRVLDEYLVFKKAFEDVMYQEYSNSQTYVDQFLDSARKTVADSKANRPR